MKIELTEARLVKKRDHDADGPGLRFRYHYRRFIEVDGKPIGMDRFIETVDAPSLTAAKLKRKHGIWQGMALGPDGYRVPEVDKDPDKVAAAVVGYLQERGIL